jgi:imidazoleglycerol phosphate dehydratase HisB
MAALGLAMARGAKRERKTRETSMEVSVALDGRAIADIDTVSGLYSPHRYLRLHLRGLRYLPSGDGMRDGMQGIAFLDSMLAEIVAGSRISMVVKVRGDLWIDDHHTAEDSMITLGQVLNEALGDRGGCCRMGCASAEHPQSTHTCRP